MMDLQKKSHERYANGFYQRLISPQLTIVQRDRFLDAANSAEMCGEYEEADALRRLACGM